jgi:hypothetical protein
MVPNRLRHSDILKSKLNLLFILLKTILIIVENGKHKNINKNININGL